MSDERYIQILLDADSKWLGVRLVNDPYINMNYESEDVAYVYTYRVSDFLLSEDDLKWSKLDGYLDPQNDPDYREYEYYKSRLTKRYGSIEN